MSSSRYCTSRQSGDSENRIDKYRGFPNERNNIDTRHNNVTHPHNAIEMYLYKVPEIRDDQNKMTNWHNKMTI